MARTRGKELLLGEWACLGLLHVQPSHGFALAARMAPEADVGRIWSMSRALTYRAVEQLAARGLIEPVLEEPGLAGGNRTVYSITRAGRTQLRRWLTTPVAHVRDIRGELLLKIHLAGLVGIDLGDMLNEQHHRLCAQRDALTAGIGADDPVDQWRVQAASAAIAFVGQLLGTGTGTRRP